MKYILISIMFIPGSVLGQSRDSTIILSDSEAIDYIHKGFKLRTEFNPITQRYVSVLDVILTTVPLWIDTVGSKKVISMKKTKTSKVYYGLAGIKKEPDSSKIFYKRYLELKKKGIPDSNNIYYNKLKKQKT